MPVLDHHHSNSMADYLDIGYNVQRMVDDIHRSALETERREKEAAKKNSKIRGRVDPNAFLRVREAVCVVGRDREAVSFIKNQVGQLQEHPFPIEGFHVKNPGDLKDGALLVPKLILVARHCPGRKLLDDDGDEGHLDFVYDEAVEMEADVMVVYIGLPRTIYKPMRHMVHHPKLAETVFPTQPLLRRLATDNCLITLTDQSELNNLQKNVLREWLTKPVDSQHPVYQVADYLSSVELSRSGRFDFDPSSNKRITYYTPSASTMDPYNADDIGIDFAPATEEHPLADKKSKKKKRKEKKEKREKKERGRRSKRDLGTLEELVDDDLEPGVELNTLGKPNFAFSGQAFDNFV